MHQENSFYAVSYHTALFYRSTTLCGKESISKLRVEWLLLVRDIPINFCLESGWTRQVPVADPGRRRHRALQTMLSGR